MPSCASTLCNSSLTRRPYSARWPDFCAGRQGGDHDLGGGGPKSKHLPPESSIVDAGAIAEAAGLNVLVREEPEGWLDEQRTFFELVIAADNDEAEPAIRALAEEGRTFLSIPESSIRRLLLIATD